MSFPRKVGKAWASAAASPRRHCAASEAAADDWDRREPSCLNQDGCNKGSSTERGLAVFFYSIADLDWTWTGPAARIIHSFWCANTRRTVLRSWPWPPWPRPWSWPRGPKENRTNKVPQQGKTKHTDNQPNIFLCHVIPRMQSGSHTRQHGMGQQMMNKWKR